MNRERRQRIQNAINTYLARLEEIKEEAIAELEDVRDEEDNAYGNLPYQFQDGETGEAMREAIDAIDNAILDIEEEPDFSDLYEACGIDS